VGDLRESIRGSEAHEYRFGFACGALLPLSSSLLPSLLDDVERRGFKFLRALVPNGRIVNSSNGLRLP